MTNTQDTLDRTPHGARQRARRGVTFILAILALICIASLSATMAVVANANLRAADSHLKVNRAMSAADTGMAFAARRLNRETKRFVVAKGQIDTAFASDIWHGTYTAEDGKVDVLPPVGYIEGSPAVSLMDALLNAHDADLSGHAVVIEPGDERLPDVDGLGVLHAPPICLTSDGNGDPDPEGPHFRLSYELHRSLPYVIVKSTGFDREINRTVEMWLRLDKKIEFAVLSPNRIMIGSNVRVEGPLGSRYGIDPNELTTDNGDPLIMRSDFYGMDPALDSRLDLFFDHPNGIDGDEVALAAYDSDQDNQLRIDHTIEAPGIESSLIDYDSDEYVSDWDIFLEHYDADFNGMVVYDEALAIAAPGTHPTTPEFEDIDNQLARLIDFASPDRNGDGIIEMCDDGSLELDCKLGYGDGILDRRDGYAKVKGRLVFAVERDEWEAAHGEPYQTIVHGPIRPGIDKQAVQFDAPEDELRELTTDMFDDSLNALRDLVTGPPFHAQLSSHGDSNPNDNGGAATGDPEWIDPTDPGFTGDPLFGYESTPLNSPGAYDHFQRPRFINMTFKNVLIPMGNNGLFENCTFIGVVFIDTEPECDYDTWNLLGAIEPVRDAAGDIIDYAQTYPGLAPIVHPTHGTVADTKPFSNNIRFNNCTFIGSLSARKPDRYCHWRNKFQLTGNTRFYIDPADPDLQTQPDKDDIIDEIDALLDDARIELAKSSIHCVGWSGDLGNFTNEQAADPTLTPKVKLKGTIICGLMDIRGTADVFGTLLMTFRPQFGAGPLVFGGRPEGFNTTIGYFGLDDGDGEGESIKGGEITLRYNPDAILPDGVLWSMRADPDPSSYVEGGT